MAAASMQQDSHVSLPDGVLADVLRLLPPRSLAASRCVCKQWLALIDARSLLVPHLLPRPLLGLFINFVDNYRPYFFCRPPGTAINTKPAFSPRRWTTLLDHCNGLLLYEDYGQHYVCNPATRRWYCLPGLPAQDYAGAYLVFDPAVSLHYEVFLIPELPTKTETSTATIAKSKSEHVAQLESPRVYGVGSVEESAEWPPSRYKLQVFSSRTGQWEERAFVRSGDAAGTLHDMLLEPRDSIWGPRQRYAVHWRGALYVHCPGGFLMRLSSEEEKYEVVKFPKEADRTQEDTRCFLGRSEKGLYYAKLDDFKLQVWGLVQSCGMDWVLRYEVDIESCLKGIHNLDRALVDRSWILDDYDDDDSITGEDDDGGGDSITGENDGDGFEWNSDEHNVIDFEHSEENEFHVSTDFDFLGFHPKKEVVFLATQLNGLAYHLNSGKVQYLGYLRPKGYYYTNCAGIYEAFPYTPCLIDGLPCIGKTENAG